MVFEEYLEKVNLDSVKPNHEQGSYSKLCVVCGPLLRYWGLDGADGDRQTWRGSVAYVTRDSESDYDNFPAFLLENTELKPFRYAQKQGMSFWRYDVDLPIVSPQSQMVTYELEGHHNPFNFWIPGSQETMRTMFYSCNGFSLAVDPANFKGSLWDDVIRRQTSDRPFHVMLGGGDQLYCDAVKTVLPPHLLEPYKRLGAYRSEEERATLVDILHNYYLKAYLQWFGKGAWTGTAGSTHQSSWPLASATIPMLNIWDDHDIIDGFGSYPHPLQKDRWWLAVGNIAHEYYMLFQQCVSTEEDPKMKDSAWCSSGRPGPYIESPAFSLYARLGQRAAFFGLDCRTDRTKHVVCAEQSYDAMFTRLSTELKAAKGKIQHLYVMLGVPIAYPRMVWAEGLMGSWVVKPVTWLAKSGVAFKGFVNDFDGEVELLDDLNDHWCANHHKKERNAFLFRLNKLAATYSVRITILTGDVHLAAVGRFQSTAKAKLAPVNDPWLMVCPVSSAIVNTPPPSLLADFMNKRNKVHHLRLFDGHRVAEEDLVPIFGSDVDGTARNNNCTLPRRNYCILEPDTDNVPPEGEVTHPGPVFTEKNTREMTRKEEIPYTTGSIRMMIQAEHDPQASSGETRAYEMYIPPLQAASTQQPASE